MWLQWSMKDARCLHMSNVRNGKENSKEAAAMEAKEKTGIGVGGPKQPLHQPGYRSSPERQKQ